MGYGRALLQRDVREEEVSLQKAAKKKGLWGSIGRTLGSLGVMALTGGAVNPLTLGLLTGGASLLGGAIGAKAAGGKLTGGKFFKSDREGLQKELGAFGSQNITSSLKSGIMAGLGQAAKLQKAKLFGKDIVATPTASKGFLKSMDFEGSMVGKAFDKRAIGKELVKAGEASLGTGTRYQRSPIAAEGWSVDPTYGDRGIPRGQIPEGGIDRLKRGLQEEEILSRSKVQMIPGEDTHLYGGKLTPKSTTIGRFDADKLLDWDDDMADVAVKSGGERITAYDLAMNKRKALEGFLANIQRPDVPLATEDEFFTGNHYPLKDYDPGFSDFDESSWAQGKKTLSNIDYDLANKDIPWQNKVFSGSSSRFRY